MEYNVRTTLNADDLQGDMMVMQALRQCDETHGVGSNFSVENGSRTLLEAASMPAQGPPLRRLPPGRAAVREPGAEAAWAADPVGRG